MGFSDNTAPDESGSMKLQGVIIAAIDVSGSVRFMRTDYKTCILKFLSSLGVLPTKCISWENFARVEPLNFINRIVDNSSVRGGGTDPSCFVSLLPKVMEKLIIFTDGEIGSREVARACALLSEYSIGTLHLVIIHDSTANTSVGAGFGSVAQKFEITTFIGGKREEFNIYSIVELVAIFKTLKNMTEEFIQNMIRSLNQYINTDKQNAEVDQELFNSLNPAEGDIRNVIYAFRLLGNKVNAAIRAESVVEFDAESATNKEVLESMKPLASDNRLSLLGAFNSKIAKPVKDYGLNSAAVSQQVNPYITATGGSSSSSSSTGTSLDKAAHEIYEERGTKAGLHPWQILLNEGDEELMKAIFTSTDKVPIAFSGLAGMPAYKVSLRRALRYCAVYNPSALSVEGWQNVTRFMPELAEWLEYCKLRREINSVSVVLKEFHPEGKVYEVPVRFDIDRSKIGEVPLKTLLLWAKYKDTLPDFNNLCLENDIPVPPVDELREAYVADIQYFSYNYGEKIPTFQEMREENSDIPESNNVGEEIARRAKKVFGLRYLRMTNLYHSRYWASKEEYARALLSKYPIVPPMTSEWIDELFEAYPQTAPEPPRDIQSLEEPQVVQPDYRSI